MSGTSHEALTLLSKMLKAPPLKALSLFTSSTHHNIHHTPQSVSIIIHHLLSFNMISHAQSVILQFLSGKITSPLFTTSSLLSYLTHNCKLLNSILVYETIISAHVKAELPMEEVLVLFDEMADRGLVPTSNTFNDVLKFLIKSNGFEKAWWVFEKNKRKVGLDVYTFGILIKGCCDDGDVNRGFEVLSEMCSMGLSPNVVGEVEKAKKLFLEMGDVGLVANQYTYTVLINGFFKKGLKKDGFELYEKMKGEGALPDLHTYNSVLHAYCTNGDMHNAFELFDEMRHREVTGNVVTYNILIEGLCLQRRVGEANKLVGEMRRRGLNPNIRTYNMLIDGYCRAGMLDKALNLFDQLKSFGLPPSVITYNVLIAGCSINENSLQVLDFVREMEERGISPSKVTYTILIDFFKALQVLSNMKRANLVADVCTYGVLIKGWCNQGNMKEASKLLKMLGEMKFEPSDVIYNTMIYGYCREGSSYKALKLLREMAENGMTPNEASYNMTIQVLWGDGKWEEAQNLLSGMIKSGLRPSDTHFDMMYKAKPINM
ncbi:hypothetical protein CDL12_01955 [Handroanthus impetiginosus]|uniref:Pentacotripeptide-repeat region of PRORP domain-containing protein n=1 Tax=Handroanthus impetiginosus TaxID=429701 RepID=A0A2G9I6B7_9LAMI|nr:hypothetical protein CDL12_01955 [Handroanthus impetiginosus]